MTHVVLINARPLAKKQQKKNNRIDRKKNYGVGRIFHSDAEYLFIEWRIIMKK